MICSFRSTFSKRSRLRQSPRSRRCRRTTARYSCQMARSRPGGRPIIRRGNRSVRFAFSMHDSRFPEHFPEAAGTIVRLYWTLDHVRRRADGIWGSIVGGVGLVEVQFDSQCARSTELPYVLPDRCPGAGRPVARQGLDRDAGMQARRRTSAVGLIAQQHFDRPPCHPTLPVRRLTRCFGSATASARREDEAAVGMLAAGCTGDVTVCAWSGRGPSWWWRGRRRRPCLCEKEDLAASPSGG